MGVSTTTKESSVRLGTASALDRLRCLRQRFSSLLYPLAPGHTVYIPSGGHSQSSPHSPPHRSAPVASKSPVRRHPSSWGTLGGVCHPPDDGTRRFFAFGMQFLLMERVDWSHHRTLIVCHPLGGCQHVAHSARMSNHAK